MKKISSLLAIFLTASLFLIGCQQTTGGSSDPFSDCSTDVDRLELSDGIWTLKTSDTGTSNGVSYSNEIELKALVSRNDYNFTSGTQTIIMKTPDLFGADYEYYQALSDSEKKQVQEIYKYYVRQNLEQSGYGTIKSIEMNDSTTTAVLNMSNASLRQMKREFNPNNLPARSKIKTNSNKTKYTLSYTNNNKNVVYYISKD